jgi:hypothetical protein
MSASDWVVSLVYQVWAWLMPRMTKSLPLLSTSRPFSMWRPGAWVGWLGCPVAAGTDSSRPSTPTAAAASTPPIRGLVLMVVSSRSSVP